ncbi:uracil-DNA glycosylase [Clostridiaceae bacterium NSJ-31]|uniref:Type-4 uracil-DNA glycosylase n=1 Tax=Ligaoa zhengdingensis TaxID=2763658 RepID=A0A926I3V7_9FIRM|nr:uracil-DNA glycosylase [Ligaoa zhengdingensis]MBC8545913.1 uracil-DNA glycosylase [Ligaoa zhengdingensis]
MVNSWEELRAQAMQCEKCNLCRTRTNVVFGTGPQDAKIMLIGEGPGENEDLQGEPFVGRGGQLLDKMLKAVDLSRQKNVYIANMVKCRPPQNRDPKPEESEACIGYLRNQVALLRPRIIVCLGRISAIRLISPNFKVTKEHGVWFEKNGVLMMGTFHPAALLRTPASKPAGLEDFLSLKEKALELCPEIFE